MTFAGSPDRVESRLVPEAGFELDTFEISGFPRKPSLELVRALVRAAKAPFACRAILRRRRPDVVLGGGGYVAGPMVARGPAEPDPGGADRGRRASRAREPAGGAVRLEALSRLRDRGTQRRRRSRSSAGRFRPRTSVRAGPTRAHASGSGPTTPVVAVFGALAGATSLNEMAVSAWGDEGPTVLHVSGERDYASLATRVHRPGYLLMPQTDHFGDVLAAADVAVSRAGGTVWELAAAGLPSILVPYPHATADHQTLNARHFERGGGAVVVPNAEIATVPALVGSTARRSRPARRDARGDAVHGPRRRGRADRRGGDRACPPLTKPLAGRAALLRRDRRLGHVRVRQHRARARGRGSRLGPRATRSSWARSTGSRSTSAASRRRPTAGRSSSRRRTCIGATESPGRVPRRARRGPAVDRRRRRARQDDDRGDDRLRPGGDRSRPRLDHRRHRSAARRQRGRWRRLARRRGRRVRPLDRVAARRRSPSLTNIELDHHASYASEAELRAFFDAWLATVPQVVLQLGAAARRARARRARRPQPPERRRRARRARACRRAARGGRGGDRALPGRRPEARARRRPWRRHGLRRLRPQPDRARGDAAHARGR